jgi:hypothetical protein
MLNCLNVKADPSFFLRPALAILMCVMPLATAKALSVDQKYHYLVEATNEIMHFAALKTTPPPPLLERLLETACDTLNTLVDDPEFKTDLEKAISKGAGKSGFFAELKRDLWLFSEQFIEKEHDLLKAEGLSEETIGRILWSANFFKDGLTRPADLTSLIRALSKFRDDVCQKAKENPNLDQAALDSILTRVFGVLLIGADALSEVEPPIGWIAAASVNIGLHMAIEGKE